MRQNRKIPIPDVPPPRYVSMTMTERQWGTTIVVAFILALGFLAYMLGEGQEPEIKQIYIRPGAPTIPRGERGVEI